MQGTWDAETLQRMGNDRKDVLRFGRVVGWVGGRVKTDRGDLFISYSSDSDERQGSMPEGMARHWVFHKAVQGEGDTCERGAAFRRGDVYKADEMVILFGLCWVNYKMLKGKGGVKYQMPFIGIFLFYLKASHILSLVSMRS